MRILVVSTLYPLPGNVARGTFVSDNVQLLKKMGHDVKIVNPLPRMTRYLESAKPTLKGVSTAPKEYEFAKDTVFCPKYFALSGGSAAWVTKLSIKMLVNKSIKWLDGFSPELIISHTLWPSGIFSLTLARKLDVPCIGVVHGWDVDVGLKSQELQKTLRGVISSLDAVVSVSNSLNESLLDLSEPKFAKVIPCQIDVGKDWKKPISNFKGRWRREPIDILFPSDPRRPEKDYYLALECGRELETRGWVVGITTLKQQPRDLVWDRMMVANLTLITSERESGPMVTKESILCGTPVVSVNVGDVSEWLPEKFVSKDRSAKELADCCERALAQDWNEINLGVPSQFLEAEVMAKWEELFLRIKNL